MTFEFNISKISDDVQKAIEAEHPEYAEPEIPDDLYRIFDFLPELLQDDSEEKYIDALQLAAETSFYNGLYQFAYIQYHMLFMTVVYFVLLKVSKIHKEEFDKAIYYLLKDRKGEFYSPENTKNGELYFGSYAAIGESDVFMLLRVIGLDDSLLGELKNLVKSRNVYAHANGRLMLTSETLFIEEIQRYNSYISRIFDLLKSDIVNLYKETITNPDFYNPEIRSYDDPDEQIVEEFIKENSLSRTEINWLRKIKTKEFEHCTGYEHIKDLHIALCHYYTVLVEDDANYHAIEDEYYHYKYANKANEFVENELGISAYRCAKDGGEFPVYDCPDCGADQLAYDVESGKAHCFACETDFNSDELSFCDSCGSIMRCNEINMCENCIEHKTKDN